MIPTKKCILDRILKERNWTQQKLVEATKIPGSILSAYRRNPMTNYNINYLFAIKNALELTCIDDLFEEGENNG